MRIVYFIDHLRPDGTQKILTQLVEGLAAFGYEQAVVCLNDSWAEEVVACLHSAGCEIRIVGKQAFVFGVGFVTVSRWLKHERFDVAVTMLFFADIIGKLLARQVKVPRIVTSLRARNENYTIWQRWLERVTMPLADTVVINSRQFRDFVIEEEGVRPEKIRIIANGIRCDDYLRPVDKVKFIEDLGLRPGINLVGSIGRLTSQKGFDLLIQAVKLLRNDKVHLLIIGEGNREGNLKALVERLGLESQVHFLGHQNNIPEILNCLDLYVQPSRFEGVPNALLEAMAAGRPVVAYAVDGILDAVEHEVDGLLVPSNDVTALANAINQLLADPKKADRYGLAAQKKIKERYSIGYMIDAWNSLFMDLKSNFPSGPVE